MPAVVRVGDTINLRVTRAPLGYVTAEVTAVTNQNTVDCVYYNPDRVVVEDATRATKATMFDVGTFSRNV